MKTRPLVLDEHHLLSSKKLLQLQHNSHLITTFCSEAPWVKDLTLNLQAWNSHNQSWIQGSSVPDATWGWPWSVWNCSHLALWSWYGRRVEIQGQVCCACQGSGYQEITKGNEGRWASRCRCSLSRPLSVCEFTDKRTSWSRCILSWALSLCESLQVRRQAQKENLLSHWAGTASPRSFWCQKSMLFSPSASHP